jgi:hypothetical protein
MLRSIAGVIVSFLFMVISGVGLQLILAAISMSMSDLTDLDDSYYIDGLEGTPFMKIAVPTAMVVVGILGGVLCAVVGRTRASILVLAGLVLVYAQIALYNNLQKQLPKEPRDPNMTVMQVMETKRLPMWITMFGPFGQSLGVLVGGMVLARGGQRKGVEINIAQPTA